MTDILVEYYRDKKGAPKGVVVAIKYNATRTSIGWSMCHPLDVFDKERALQMATGRALNAGGNTRVPMSLKPLVSRMAARSIKYFKVIKCMECVQ